MIIGGKDDFDHEGRSAKLPKAQVKAKIYASGSEKLWRPAGPAGIGFFGVFLTTNEHEEKIMKRGT